MNTPERFYLTVGEKNSPLWLKLAKHLEDRLQRLREQNDSLLSEAETAAIRGKIATYKELLRLSRDDVQI